MSSWSFVAYGTPAPQGSTADVCASTWGDCPYVPGHHHVCLLDLDHSEPHTCCCAATAARHEVSA